MRRLSYPTAAKPCDHAVLMARYMTADRLRPGILYRRGDWMVMAGESVDGGFFVSVDDGDQTTDRSFETEDEVVRHLMNLVAYAPQEAA